MSFFFEWCRDRPEQDTLATLWQPQQNLQIQATEHGFALFVAQQQPAAAVVRFFAGSLTAVMVDALQLLLSEQLIQLRQYQPHAELSPAIEFRLSAALSADVASQIREFAASWQLEVVCLNAPVLLSAPGLLVMDMDSTAIQIECIDEIAMLAGVGEQVAAVTARAMNGELDFAMSLKARVAALKGADAAILAQVLAEIPLMPGLRSLVETLLAKNWRVMIASGGFTYFTKALQQQLQLTATFANELAIVDGVLTGEVIGDIVDAHRKAQVVTEQAALHQIKPSQTVAIGDGANDLPMLAAAALGVAFHAKPIVQAQARVAIRHGSLLQLLYALDEQDWRL